MNILFVTCRSPWPPRRGDQMRALQFIEALSPQHEVKVLLPRTEETSIPDEFSDVSPTSPKIELIPYDTDGPLIRLLKLGSALLRGRPLQSSLFHHRHLGRLIREHAPQADLVILQLARLHPHIEDLRETPCVFDLIDSLALNFEKRAEVDTPWLRPLFKLEAKRLLSAEKDVLEKATLSFVVCDRDRDFLLERTQTPRNRIRTLPLNRPRSKALSVPKAPQPTLVFTGNLGYFVNADGLKWFIREIWPRLSFTFPELRLKVAGSRPAPSLVRLLNRTSGVFLVEGPEDLRREIASAHVAIAPLRAGSGVPVKIIEGWAEGVPVIASPWAAQGIDGNADEDLLIAETPEQWEKAIQRLLESEDLRCHLILGGEKRLAPWSALRLKEALNGCIQGAC